MTGRLVLVREGFGEAGSLESLVARVARDLGVNPDPIASLQSIRVAVTNAQSALKAVEIAARYSPDAVLVTADCDDDCPRDLAPTIAAALRARAFPFPVAVVLFYREYETLALSVAGELDGVELISTKGTVIVRMSLTGAPPTDPEAHRDAKGWISRNLFGGTSYKPTLHQRPLTARLLLADLGEADLSSYRRLRTAVGFLADQMNAGSAGAYPPASAGS
ncbi:hypothetical protein [Pseudolysinimonas yzui]|uniref:Uncharacterized protein n=1 Tax=Pseudolysinimonas yzui TaxID=2708254 RepID=A0A8J3M666_9MICO|nr:hypothetical protein [Pseudolysinimonas yzui]GHF24960.1 hypothetical protein GCM10011600_27540 [Pseudolysinimonas yzui]